MVHPLHNNDRRCGSDRRIADRRQGILPAPNETLSLPHVAAAYILVLAIFCLDVIARLGSGMCFLYLVPLTFLAMYSSSKQWSPVIAIAAISAILTGIGLALSHSGPFWDAVATRVFAVTVIGTTVMLSLVRKRAEDDVKVLRGLLPICSYCKKIRDDGGYWQQVERYIAARSEVDFSHGLCPECASKHFPELDPQNATKASARNPLGFFGRQEG